MAFPALRQPKCVPKLPEKQLLKPSKAPVFAVADSSSYLILTMKDGKKLVVSSDAYNGILKAVDSYECVFCADTIKVDVNIKESHKRSNKHRTAMDGIPFNEALLENLIRQISYERAYCTLCHAVISHPFLNRHIASEAHSMELAMATERAHTYKPSV